MRGRLLGRRVLRNPEVTVADALYFLFVVVVAVSFSWLGVALVTDADGNGRGLVVAVILFVVALAAAFQAAVLATLLLFELFQRVRSHGGRSR